MIIVRPILEMQFRRPKVVLAKNGKAPKLLNFQSLGVLPPNNSFVWSSKTDIRITGNLLAFLSILLHSFQPMKFPP